MEWLRLTKAGPDNPSKVMPKNEKNSAYFEHLFIS
jgi:hypothetical protein